MRLVIIEDDSMLRENLRLLLAGEQGIEVVGAFGSAEDALERLHACQPDLCLVDLGLPFLSGAEFIARAREQMPAMVIMAHTIHEDRETVFSAIKAGASGYLLKGSSSREIIESLHSLHSGGAPMSPRIARRIIVEFQENKVDERYILSEREKEILRGLAEGLAYKEIGDKLSISPHTVHSHIKKIYEKLQAQNRQDALTKARRKSII
ncbi:MAG TPA: response regulator transcription factor [Syntrophobacteraceae bacterium]|nr:response regulator transcription factor [Syntrophobacteraceae bacterium]